jgi:UDP-N-acetylglucosamine 2-epimerase (non-hydrolysing)
MNKDSHFDVHVCITAQHREMLDQVLEIFNIVPDTDLNLMTQNQSLASLTARAIEGIDKVVKELAPDICIVQGDTTTALASALTCFYNKIPVAHIEAGLRTFNKYAPFPEEINRVLATHISDFHFAPTEGSKANLIKENICNSKILVTGNTVIDALHITKDKIERNEIKITNTSVLNLLSKQNRFILVTSHRRENFGDGIESICKALKKFAQAYPSVNIIFPVHLNPNIKTPVYNILADCSNIYLLDPLDYVSFVALMSECYLVLTDSGGVQEEAPGFGKPVLVMRETTERPEALTAGLSKLVGTDEQKIFDSLVLLMEDKQLYSLMSGRANPYGDGKASQRIVTFLKEKC